MIEEEIRCHCLASPTKLIKVCSLAKILHRYMHSVQLEIRLRSDCHCSNGGEDDVPNVQSAIAKNSIV